MPEFRCSAAQSLDIKISPKKGPSSIPNILVEREMKTQKHTNSYLIAAWTEFCCSSSLSPLLLLLVTVPVF